MLLALCIYPPRTARIPAPPTYLYTVVPYKHPYISQLWCGVVWRTHNCGACATRTHRQQPLSVRTQLPTSYPRHGGGAAIRSRDVALRNIPSSEHGITRARTGQHNYYPHASPAAHSLLTHSAGFYLRSVDIYNHRALHRTTTAQLTSRFPRIPQAETTFCAHADYQTHHPGRARRPSRKDAYLDHACAERVWLLYDGGVCRCAVCGGE